MEVFFRLSETVTQRRGLFDAVEKKLVSLTYAHARLSQKSTTRPPSLCKTMWYNGLAGGRISFHRVFSTTIRTSIDHRQNLSNFYISAQYTYCQTFPNLWQKYCPTFGKSVSQRLARVFPNVWQECFQTFDKGVFNV